ncbi:hypothetical protein QBC37DRAFT_72620 [Rhypophila decipiens]|uniref:Uncharacterized protein n=1 Tax=Rhypophila decipiens TaxID=261697 RepID=A0AAN6YJU6_9PEZI|nr:hypothetical protein QBC37DRAFT_72620 [Rhypophila decipiens]
MFLHSGASLHGHEYSDRPVSIPSPQAAAQNLRYPLLWSPFSSAKPRVTVTVDGVVQADNILTQSPIIRQRPASDSYNPRTLEHVRFLEPAEEEDARSVLTQDVISESDFSEVISMDGMSAMGHPRRPRRKLPRKHTTYFLGYPTPKLLAKKKVMQKVLPRLLLQVQKVSEDGRSRPILEIFPSSRIAGPVITPRLAKRFPGIFGVKRQLGYDDLVLVRRDDDDSTSDGTESEEESLDKKNLVAVYSPLKHSDAAEIVLDNGAVWLASRRPNGSYDFVHEDDQGNQTTVRWAHRSGTSIPPRVQTSPDTIASTNDVPQTRYTFSIINPLYRRHPVLASLTQSSLDIQDTYTSITSFSGYTRVKPASRTVSMTSTVQPFPNLTSSPTTPATEPTSLHWSSDPESENEGISPLVEPESKRMVNTVDDSTKLLISVTALWVALRSGWSPNYTPSHSETSGAVPSGGRSRRNTWTRGTTADSCGRLTPQLSESETSQHTGPNKRSSLPAQLPATAGPDAPPPSRTPTPVSSIKNGPRRATSTGAAFMQRHINHHNSEASESHQGHHLNGKRASVPPPPATRDNPHILSPIPATPVNRHHSAILPANHNVFAEANITTPRSASAMGFRSLGNQQKSKEVLTAGEKHKKGGLRAKVVRWVHKLSAR